MNELRPKFYLLDVEGTIAPLSLTTEVLFPYARTHFESFLERNIADRSMAEDLAMLNLENLNEPDPEAPRILPSGRDSRTTSMSPAKGIPRILAYVLWLMDRDRKSTALKSLQGKIWKEGFENGELKGTLFDDVPDALRRWSANGRIAIYSSGSVEAQELFFRYSTHGDLTPLISRYFDTRTGPKLESASYAAIAAALHLQPRDVLFFSDSVPELDAARQAGCPTRLVVRPGNAPVEDPHSHSAVESFTGL